VLINKCLCFLLTFTLVNELSAKKYNFDNVENDKILTHFNKDATSYDYIEGAFNKLNKSRKYRIDINNITYENNTIIIDVNSRRTNMQTNLIKTYWLAGLVLDKIKSHISKVYVVLNISTKNTEIIVTSTGINEVTMLSKNESTDLSLFKSFLSNLKIHRKNNHERK
tara:strand:- start:645 stop:1145 length:501 start_codon:yes stop_codon:yes gene_type:complete